MDEKKSDQPSQLSSRLLRSPNGLPMFPPTGRIITLEMVKAAEEEMDIEDAQAGGMTTPR